MPALCTRQDMLVRVKSASINQAKTPMDVLTPDQIIPFIERST